jgi:hypothetical protein
MPDDDRNHRQGADPVEKNQSPALTRTVAQLPVTVNENIHCNKKKPPGCRSRTMPQLPVTVNENIHCNLA